VVKVVLEAIPSPLEINPAQLLLMIIDMHNSTVSQGGLSDLLGGDISRAREIIPQIARLAGVLRTGERPVVHISHQYSADFRELGDPESVLWQRIRSLRVYRQHPEWRERCLIRGTWGAEIISELAPAPDDIVLEKSRYSAFWGTNLDTVLRAYNTRYLAITGVWANICVESTLRDAFHYGYFPILVRDAVAATNPAAFEATVANVQGAYGWVTTSQNLIDALKQKPGANK